MNTKHNTSVSSGDKTIIFYKRDYRHVKNNPLETILLLFITVIPFLCLLVALYSDYSYWLNLQLAKFFQHFFGIEADIVGDSMFPFMGDFYHLSLSGATPNFTLCLVVVVASLFAIAVLLQIFLENKPLMIYLTITLSITLISALFFIFFPNHFPYTLGDYTYLYISQQFVVWAMIAIVSSIALSLLPGIHGFDFLTFFLIMVYTIIYGSVRYIIFMVGLQFVTNMFIPTCYFMLGMFFDFMNIIAIYSLFVKRVSEQYNKRKENSLWKWS